MPCPFLFDISKYQISKITATTNKNFNSDKAALTNITIDPMDENEIANKIDYLLENPNNTRLMSSLDFNRISYKAEVEKLENYCNQLCN